MDMFVTQLTGLMAGLMLGFLLYGAYLLVARWLRCRRGTCGCSEARQGDYIRYGEWSGEDR